MKTYCYLLFAMLFASTVSAQSFTEFKTDSTSGLITFSEVVKTDSLGKNEFYNRAKAWFVNTFKSSKAVLEIDDKELGKLTGKGNSVIQVESAGLFGKDLYNVRLLYTVTVLLKDNRYKVVIDHIYTQVYPNQYVPNPPQTPAENYTIEKENNGNRSFSVQYRAKIINEANAISGLLRKSMQLKSKESDF